MNAVWTVGSRLPSCAHLGQVCSSAPPPTPPLAAKAQWPAVRRGRCCVLPGRHEDTVRWWVGWPGSGPGRVPWRLRSPCFLPSGARSPRAWDKDQRVWDAAAFSGQPGTQAPSFVTRAGFRPRRPGRAVLAPRSVASHGATPPAPCVVGWAGAAPDSLQRGSGGGGPLGRVPAGEGSVPASWLSGRNSAPPGPGAVRGGPSRGRPAVACVRPSPSHQGRGPG